MWLTFKLIDDGVIERLNAVSRAPTNSVLHTGMNSYMRLLEVVAIG